MEQRTSSFEDHLNIVESGQDKTASLGRRGSILDRLAGELGFEKEAEGGITAPGAPTAEGEVSPAASSVAGANAAVVAATEAVATPQTTIAGGNPAEAAAGEIPAQTKPNEGLAISAGDGMITDANQLNRTPESVAAAAQYGGGDEGSASNPNPLTASSVPDQSLGAEKTAEARKIGQMIAHSFQSHLEKQASDQEYTESLSILNDAGMLEGYNIKDPGMSKQASFLPENCLEKLANMQPLSREEIVGAAVELIELEKDASEAAELGREDAHEAVEEYVEMQKEAADEQGRIDARNLAAHLVEQGEMEESIKVAEDAQVSALMQDPAVVNAVNTLKAKNLL